MYRDTRHRGIHTLVLLFSICLFHSLAEPDNSCIIQLERDGLCQRWSSGFNYAGIGTWGYGTFGDCENLAVFGNVPSLNMTNELVIRDKTETVKCEQMLDVIVIGSYKKNYPILRKDLSTSYFSEFKVNGPYYGGGLTVTINEPLFISFGESQNLILSYKRDNWTFWYAALDSEARDFSNKETRQEVGPGSGDVLQGWFSLQTTNCSILWPEKVAAYREGTVVLPCGDGKGVIFNIDFSQTSPSILDSTHNPTITREVRFGIGKVYGEFEMLIDSFLADNYGRYVFYYTKIESGSYEISENVGTSFILDDDIYGLGCSLLECDVLANDYQILKGNNYCLKENGTDLYKYNEKQNCLQGIYSLEEGIFIPDFARTAEEIPNDSRYFCYENVCEIRDEDKIPCSEQNGGVFPYFSEPNSDLKFAFGEVDDCSLITRGSCIYPNRTDVINLIPLGDGFYQHTKGDQMWTDGSTVCSQESDIYERNVLEEKIFGIMYTDDDSIFYFSFAENDCMIITKEYDCLLFRGTVWCKESFSTTCGMSHSGLYINATGITTTTTTTTTTSTSSSTTTTTTTSTTRRPEVSGSEMISSNHYITILLATLITLIKKNPFFATIITLLYLICVGNALSTDCSMFRDLSFKPQNSFELTGEAADDHDCGPVGDCMAIDISECEEGNGYNLYQIICSSMDRGIAYIDSINMLIFSRGCRHPGEDEFDMNLFSDISYVDNSTSTPTYAMRLRADSVIKTIHYKSSNNKNLKINSDLLEFNNKKGILIKDKDNKLVSVPISKNIKRVRKATPVSFRSKLRNSKPVRYLSSFEHLKKIEHIRGSTILERYGINQLHLNKNLKETSLITKEIFGGFKTATMCDSSYMGVEDCYGDSYVSIHSYWGPQFQEFMKNHSGTVFCETCNESNNTFVRYDEDSLYDLTSDSLIEFPTRISQNYNFDIIRPGFDLEEIDTSEIYSALNFFDISQSAAFSEGNPIFHSSIKAYGGFQLAGTSWDKFRSGDMTIESDIPIDNDYCRYNLRITLYNLLIPEVNRQGRTCSRESPSITKCEMEDVYLCEKLVFSEIQGEGMSKIIKRANIARAKNRYEKYLPMSSSSPGFPLNIASAAYINQMTRRLDEHFNKGLRNFIIWCGLVFFSMIELYHIIGIIIPKVMKLVRLGFRGWGKYGYVYKYNRVLTKEREFPVSKEINVCLERIVGYNLSDNTLFEGPCMSWSHRFLYIGKAIMDICKTVFFPLYLISVITPLLDMILWKWWFYADVAAPIRVVNKACKVRDRRLNPSMEYSITKLINKYKISDEELRKVQENLKIRSSSGTILSNMKGTTERLLEDTCRRMIISHLNTMASSKCISGQLTKSGNKDIDKNAAKLRDFNIELLSKSINYSTEGGSIPNQKVTSSSFDRVIEAISISFLIRGATATKVKVQETLEHSDLADKTSEAITLGIFAIFFIIMGLFLTIKRFNSLRLRPLSCFIVLLSLFSYCSAAFSIDNYIIEGKLKVSPDLEISPKSESTISTMEIIIIVLSIVLTVAFIGLIIALVRAWRKIKETWYWIVKERNNKPPVFQYDDIYTVNPRRKTNITPVHGLSRGRVLITTIACISLLGGVSESCIHPFSPNTEFYPEVLLPVSIDNTTSSGFYSVPTTSKHISTSSSICSVDSVTQVQSCTIKTRILLEVGNYEGFQKSISFEDKTTGKTLEGIIYTKEAKSDYDVVYSSHTTDYSRALSKVWSQWTRVKHNHGNLDCQHLSQYQPKDFDIRGSVPTVENLCTKACKTPHKGVQISKDGGTMGFSCSVPGFNQIIPVGVISNKVSESVICYEVYNVTGEVCFTYTGGIEKQCQDSNCLEFLDYKRLGQEVIGRRIAAFFDKGSRNPSNRLILDVPGDGNNMRNYKFNFYGFEEKGRWQYVKSSRLDDDYEIRDSGGCPRCENFIWPNPDDGEHSFERWKQTFTEFSSVSLCRGDVWVIEWKPRDKSGNCLLNCNWEENPGFADSASDCRYGSNNYQEFSTFQPILRLRERYCASDSIKVVLEFEGIYEVNTEEIELDLSKGKLIVTGEHSKPNGARLEFVSEDSSARGRIPDPSSSSAVKCVSTIIVFPGLPICNAYVQYKTDNLEYITKNGDRFPVDSSALTDPDDDTSGGGGYDFSETTSSTFWHTIGGYFAMSGIIGLVTCLILLLICCLPNYRGGTSIVLGEQGSYRKFNEDDIVDAKTGIKYENDAYLRKRNMDSQVGDDSVSNIESEGSVGFDEEAAHSQVLKKYS